MRTAPDWYAILIACQVRPIVAANWAQVFADVIQPDSFSAGDAEIDDFLGQVLHESAGLTRLSENLNYSAERLCAVWPKRFPTIADARPYANNPEALANKVYGGRMGNTDIGDGWRYRGRGILQVTGKANYQFVGDLVGQDMVDLPELMEQPHYALEACIAWWENKIPDSVLKDPERVTEIVNGGHMGLKDRIDLTALATKALNVA